MHAAMLDVCDGPKVEFSERKEKRDSIPRVWYNIQMLNWERNLKKKRKKRGKTSVIEMMRI